MRLPQGPFQRLQQAQTAFQQAVQGGTVDQVKRDIEALQQIGGSGELEWFGWFFDQGFMSRDEEMRQIELFARHIIPAFR